MKSRGILRGKFRAYFVQLFNFDVRKDYAFRFIDNVFYLPDRKLELFSQWFKAYSVNQPSFDNLSVSMGISSDNPLIYEGFNL